MAGHVTELVADSWMAKPWGRSSRSTGLSTPPGLPAEAARAVWAAAGAARVSSVSSSAEQVLTWRIMPPYRMGVRSSVWRGNGIGNGAAPQAEGRATSAVNGISVLGRSRREYRHDHS